MPARPISIPLLIGTFVFGLILNAVVINNISFGADQDENVPIQIETIAVADIHSSR